MSVPGSADLRAAAHAIFTAGVAAADPAAAVRRHLTLDGEALCIADADGESVRRGTWPGVHILACGKAAVPMAAAAVAVVPPTRLAGTPLAVTSYENAQAAPGLQVLGASHPLPDAQGHAAAAAFAAAAGRAGEGELVLALISGGASALLPLPPAPVTLAEKIETTELLLACGADIGEINTVRKHLSTLKGGGLARHAAPADLHALILSDVIGDDLSTIASGPSVPDDTTFADAFAVFERRGLHGRLPVSIREHLAAGRRGDVPDTPGRDDPLFARVGNTLIGSNRISLHAAVRAARDHGFTTRVYSSALAGEARDVAGRLCEAFGAHGADRAWLAGGETTVTLRGDGRGGRNQELALAFALAAEQRQLPPGWVLLSAGTDGIDGPTDAAGAIVDAGTPQRIREAGGDPRALLDNNDAWHALHLSGDLLLTGATGTNVADLLILLRH